MDFFRWSDNPDANYIMIEPNLKYMVSGPAALARAPKPWYLRPPPVPEKPIPVDKMRFLPTRRLQNALYSSPWKQTVGDDLDSFTYTFIHSLLFRERQRRDGSAAGIAGYFSAFGSDHPKHIMDHRDSLENMLWIIGEDVKKERARGEQPPGTALAQFAEPLYRVTKVNVKHHGDERELAGTGETDEAIKERAATQYEEYLTAWGKLQESIEEGWARKQEEKRKKAEKKAQKKAEKANAAESATEDDAKETGDGDGEDVGHGEGGTNEDTDASGVDEYKTSGTEADSPMVTESDALGQAEVVQSSTVAPSGLAEQLAEDGDGVSEPPMKRVRTE